MRFLLVFCFVILPILRAHADCLVDGLLFVPSGSDITARGGRRVVCRTNHRGDILLGAGADRVVIGAGVTLEGRIETGGGADVIVLLAGSRVAGTVDAGSGDNTLRLDGGALIAGANLGAGKNRIHITGEASISGRLTLGQGPSSITVRDAQLSIDPSPAAPWGGVTAGGRVRITLVDSLLRAVSESSGRFDPPAHFALATEDKTRIFTKNVRFEGFTLGLHGRRNRVRLGGRTSGVQAYLTRGRNRVFLAESAQADLLSGGRGRDRFHVRGQALSIEGGDGTDEIVLLGSGAFAGAVSGGRWLGSGEPWSDAEDVAAVCGGARSGYLSAAIMRLMSGCEVGQILAPFGRGIASLELVRVKGASPSRFSSNGAAELQIHTTTVKAALARHYCRYGQME